MDYFAGINAREVRKKRGKHEANLIPCFCTPMNGFPIHGTLLWIYPISLQS